MFKSDLSDKPSKPGEKRCVFVVEEHCVHDDQVARTPQGKSYLKFPGGTGTRIVRELACRPCEVEAAALAWPGLRRVA